MANIPDVTSLRRPPALLPPMARRIDPTSEVSTGLLSTTTDAPAEEKPRDDVARYCSSSSHPAVRMTPGIL